MPDAVQLLPLLLWLTLLAAFACCIAAVVFSSRVFYIQARVAWWNRRPGADASPCPQWLLAGAGGFAAVVAFALAAGQPLLIRLVLMGVLGAAAWIALDHACNRLARWAQQRDSETRHWRARAQQAGARLREISDPRQIRPATARLLRETLAARAVHLYMRGSEDFIPVHHDPQPPPTPVVFSAQSLLVRELGRFPGPRSLLTASDGKPLPWSKGPAAQLAVEQEQLRAMDACLAVPLVIDRAVAGFFLFGSRLEAASYSSAEIRYAEAVIRQSTDRLFFAEKAILEADKKAAEARALAAQDFAVAARRFLVPPEKTDLGPVELSAGWWGSERNRPLFYDIVALPGRAAGLLLAEIDAPEQEAAVRLVQLQALVRSRFRAYGEDLPELVASVRRASKWPEGVAPVHLFVARYSPDTPALTYVNAGFFPPMLVRRSGAGADLLRLSGDRAPLAHDADSGFRERRVDLHPGDLVGFANQAVTAAPGPGGEPWGEGRLIDTLLGWEEQPIGDLVSLARRTIEEFEGPLAADAPSRLLMVMRVRNQAAPLV